MSNRGKDMHESPISTRWTKLVARRVSRVAESVMSIMKGSTTARAIRYRPSTKLVIIAALLTA